MRRARAAEARLAQTRSWVRDVVRSGLLPEDALLREVSDALAADHPDLPAGTAAEWVGLECDQWRRDAAVWDDPTDFALLQAVFDRLGSEGFLVLQGCADHWAAKAALSAGPSVRGAVWFTPADVWHAIDEAMLEVNLWHADTRNAAPGDALLAEVLAAFTEGGLAAHFDEGRIEVAARWQRRPEQA